MLDIRLIRENTDLVREALKNRGIELDIDELIKVDSQRRMLLSKVDELKNKRNIASDNIGKLKAKGEDTSKEIAETKELSQKISEIDIEVGQIEEKWCNLLLAIPNIPSKDIPVGSPCCNKEVKSWGKKPNFDFEPKTHLKIAEDLDIIDFPASAKISGRGFAVYKGKGARLERALINFMLDIHTKEHKYTEIFPPFLVNKASMTGTGQLPKLEQDMYRLKDDELYLIPTAEVPVTNLHREDLLKEKDLPIYYTAYTACFRREAGSYGKDTKGLTRVHQFDKVELVKFVKPENSYNELEKLLTNAEKILQLLNLSYRVIMLATGDISFAAAKCYDIELWAPGANTYLEVSSCSNFEDFQARRANIKYKPSNGGKAVFVHTLNGSGVALARLVIAILENYQNKDGSVTIPEVLRPYMDGAEKIEKL